MIAVASRKQPRVPFARQFEGDAGRRKLWLLGLGMLLFGLAELPAIVIMSAHGSSVFGFEEAGSTHRLNEILRGWGSAGRGAAEVHVFIDLGFIVCYGLLLAGLCGRLSILYADSARPRVALLGRGLAWAALLAATVNLVQKLFLWLELHGHTAQPFPTLASLCAAITDVLAIAAVLFCVGGAVVARRLAIVG